MDVKAKSIPEGTYPEGDPFKQYEGLAALPPDTETTQKLLDDLGLSYEDYLVELNFKGYTVDVAPPHLVRDNRSRALYSDVDLHGVYDMNGNNAIPSDALENKKFYRDMNDDLKEDLVMHDPMDNWDLRNSNATNCGPQVVNGQSVTAYVPHKLFGIFSTVRTVHLDSIEAMRDFYVAFGMDWNELYGAALKAGACK
jgi:hypothetical protein